MSGEIPEKEDPPNQGCQLLKIVVGARSISAGEYLGNMEYDTGD